MDSRSRRTIRLLLASLLGMGLSLNAIPVAAGGTGDFEHPGRGLELSSSGPCVGAYRIVGTGMCTHGPDPVPDLLLARGGPAPLRTATLSQAAGQVDCDGDGESGKRVQALYAFVAGRQDRKSAYLASFRAWAAKVDLMMQTSAADSGGSRHLRWVTNSDCLLAVPSVAVSSLAETNFSTMIAELDLLGYNRSDRKYLVWFDSDPRNSSICGIGTVYVDDKPLLNLNDTQTGYARADYSCWDWSEGHELMHTLGAVQPSAPHATAGLHCTDEYDQMCYPDGISAVMTYPCPASFDQRFDCGHDDYFNASPAPGSYLATHWNTADSGWLVKDAPDTTPPSVDEPQPGLVADQTFGTNARVALSWPAAHDQSGIEAYELQRKKGSGSWADVQLGSITDTTVELDLVVGASYSFRLRARDGAGNTGAWATTPAATLTLVQETSTSIDYAGSFKRVALSGASGGYVRKTSLGGSVAAFTFSGPSVALVSTLAPNRGRATVRIDGGSWHELDLYGDATTTRYVAWATSAGSGAHTVEVRVTGEGNPSATGARVDVDAFLVWKPN